MAKPKDYSHMKAEFICRDTLTGEIRELKTKEDIDWYIKTKNERMKLKR